MKISFLILETSCNERAICIIFTLIYQVFCFLLLSYAGNSFDYVLHRVRSISYFAMALKTLISRSETIPLNDSNITVRQRRTVAGCEIFCDRNLRFKITLSDSCSLQRSLTVANSVKHVLWCCQRLFAVASVEFRLIKIYTVARTPNFSRQTLNVKRTNAKR